MPEFLQTFTIERRLYTRQAVPWTYLILPSNLQRLRERYKFAALQHQADAVGAGEKIQGTVGEFKIGDALQALEGFIIEPDVVQVQISVPSTESTSFFEDLGAFFADIDPRKGFSEEKLRTKTYQTIAIVRLSVPFENLLSPSLRGWLGDAAAPKLSLPNAEAVISLEHLSWRVNYTTQSSDFLYLPKPLTIEPRVGTKPEDMIYYTVSPTPFESHKEMIEQLEDLLKGAPLEAGGASRRALGHHRRKGTDGVTRD
jgi:hypothetical protein